MTAVEERRPNSPADWVERNLRRELTDFQRTAVEIVTVGMNRGVYNLSINWAKADWDFGGGVRFTMLAGGGMATYDFDHLTRLVIAAHDRCVRLDIEPAARRYLWLILHPREREGGMSRRHPTIEQAIADFRSSVADA